MKLQFDEWLSPMPLREFRRESFGRLPVAATAERMGLAADVMDAIRVHSIEDLLRLRAPSFHAWFHTNDGRHTTAQVTEGAARRLYAAGMTIYVQDAPELGPIAEAIANELGVAPGAVKCTLFANRPGASTRAHFDAVDLVVLQLTGSKRWRIAPNNFAPQPVRTWATLDPVPADLRIYAPGQPPCEMPECASDVELRSGSALHVPRGYWHETTSDRDSLSLHVQIVPTTWADAILAVLRNELHRDEAWREATYDWSLEEGACTLEQRASAMCQRLRDAVGRLVVDDVVNGESPSPMGARVRFVRRAQASFGVESRDAGTNTARVAIFVHDVTGTTTARVEMSEAYVSACHWIAELRTGVAVDEDALAAACKGLSRHEIRCLLRTVAELRLVRAVAA